MASVYFCYCDYVLCHDASYQHVMYHSTAPAYATSCPFHFVYLAISQEVSYLLPRLSRVINTPLALLESSSSEQFISSLLQVHRGHLIPAFSVLYIEFLSIPTRPSPISSFLSQLEPDQMGPHRLYPVFFFHSSLSLLRTPSSYTTSPTPFSFSHPFCLTLAPLPSLLLLASSLSFPFLLHQCSTRSCLPPSL